MVEIDLKLSLRPSLNEVYSQLLLTRNLPNYTQNLQKFLSHIFQDKIQPNTFSNKTRGLLTEHSTSPLINS